MSMKILSTSGFGINNSDQGLGLINADQLDKAIDQKIAPIAEQLFITINEVVTLRGDLDKTSGDLHEAREDLDIALRDLSLANGTLSDLKRAHFKRIVEKCIKKIVDLDIKKYQTMGHTCVTGSTLFGVGIFASLLTGPGAIILAPLAGMASTVNGCSAAQFYKLENDLRDLQKQMIEDSDKYVTFLEKANSQIPEYLLKCAIQEKIGIVVRNALGTNPYNPEDPLNVRRESFDDQGSGGPSYY